MISTLELPLLLQEQLCREALRSYPCECCGLIEGIVEGDRSRVTALRPMPNIAKQSDRFEIDPALHIALLRNLRDTGREIIGCYHSHPNGRAEPSACDRESADEEGFLWLICAVDADGETTHIVGFESTGDRLVPVGIVQDSPGNAGACGPA